MVTFVIGSVFFGLLILSIGLWALCLRLGLRWAKVRGVTTRRLVLATILAYVFQSAVGIGVLCIAVESVAALFVLAVSELLAIVLGTCFVIMRVFDATFFQALRAWLATLLAPAVGLALILLVVRPYLAEAFVASANSMAPTLLGEHLRGTCPQCGSPAFCSPDTHRAPFEAPPAMICEDNFHVRPLDGATDQILAADRFVVVKFVKPRRWDIVVFRFPDNPATLYVKRLVGLPGEEITIRDGRAFADGQPLSQPESLRGLQYLDTLPDVPGLPLWGTPERPAKLAADEYFVLGDFSAQSKDSRFWQHGAPGHRPFAVPASYLYGVVTHTHWPPDRWRAFR